MSAPAVDHMILVVVYCKGPRHHKLGEFYPGSKGIIYCRACGRNYCIEVL